MNCPDCGGACTPQRFTEHNITLTIEDYKNLVAPEHVMEILAPAIEAFFEEAEKILSIVEQHA